jgi:CHASE2 domain-containing sensor protein
VIANWTIAQWTAVSETLAMIALLLIASSYGTPSRAQRYRNIILTLITGATTISFAQDLTHGSYWAIGDGVLLALIAALGGLRLLAAIRREGHNGCQHRDCQSRRPGT